MPQEPTATRTDLGPLVAHYRDLLGLRDWTIDGAYVGGLVGAYAQTPLETLQPARKLARIEVSAECPPEELRPSIAHELIHVLLSPLTSGDRSRTAIMLEEQAVEALTLALARVDTDPAETLVLSRALSRTPSALAALARVHKASTGPSLRRGGYSMDPKLLMDAIEALTSGEPDAIAAALKAMIAAMAGGGAPADKPPPEAAAMEGAMQRARVAMLSRASMAALGSDVLTATKEKSADKALLRVSTALIALDRLAETSADDNVRTRRERLAKAMTGNVLSRAQAFKNPEENEREKLVPHDAWMRGSLEDLDENLKALGNGGGALQRQRVIPSGDEAGLAKRARDSGMTVDARRSAEANVARGNGKGA